MSTEARYFFGRYGILHPYKYGLQTVYMFAHESPFSGLKRLISTYLKYEVNATFFVIGAALKGNFEKLDLIKSYGFDLAPHGYIHARAPTHSRFSTISLIVMLSRFWI